MFEIFFCLNIERPLGCSYLIRMLTTCGIICADDFINPVKYSKHMIYFLMAKNETCSMGVEARRSRFSDTLLFLLHSDFFLSEHATKQWKRHTPMLW